jgi:membrane protein required for beta-lactamase induction
MEWLPSRYMGLCFCLSGNFATCIRVWRQLAIDTHTSNKDFLARCIDAALILDETSSTENPSNDDASNHNALTVITPRTRQLGLALQDLLAHTEVIGLVGLAITVLVLH